MKKLPIIVLAVGAAVAVTMQTSAAAACGPPLRPCVGYWVFPNGGEIESDRFAIDFKPGAYLADGGVAMPRMMRSEDGGLFEMEYDVETGQGWGRLRPRQVPAVGSTILLTAEEPARCDAGTTLNERYQVVEPRTLPDALGTLSVKNGHGDFYFAQCGDRVEADYADLTVVVDPSAVSFASQATYALYVDGRQFYPWSSAGVRFESNDAKPWALAHDAARVYSFCRGGISNQLESGTHIARVEATRDAVTISTPELEFTLHCEGGSIPVPRDAGPPWLANPPAGNATPDAATHDAGIALDARTAAGTDPDTGVVATSQDGCSLASSRSLAGPAWLALGLLLCWRRRPC